MISTMNSLLANLKEDINRKNKNGAVFSLIDEVIEYVNKAFAKTLSTNFDEKWFISSTLKDYRNTDSTKTYLASLIMFPGEWYEFHYFELKISIENKQIKKITIPNHKIEIPNSLLSNYPELLPLHNLQINKDYDIEYYFNIIQDTRKIHKKILTLKNKENLLLCYRNQLTFTKKNIDDFMRFYEENRINKCPKLNDVIQELTQIENNENLCTARIVLQWEESNKHRTKTEETFYVPDSLLFSDMIEDRIYLMKREFFNKSHTPACGTALISTTVSSIFKQKTKNQLKTHHESFLY